MTRGREQTFVSSSATAHYPPDLELEPVHLDIDLRVDIGRRRAAGVVTHTVTAARAGVRELVLQAVDLDVSAVTSAQPVTYRYDGRLLTIRWRDSFAAAERRDVAVTYSVTDPVTGLSFDPRRRFAVTDHETERARHWLPCVDLPSARPTLSWHLRAPADLEILANGALDRVEVHDDGTKTAHWTLNQRCPSYLACLAVGDFIRVDEAPFDEIPISYFATREYAPEDLTRAFGRTGEMLAWMTQKLRLPFPYPKYFQFAVPGVGGAMENISLVAWDAKLLLDEALDTEWRRLLDIINVHEMGHSYFGDLIVCRDFAHAWLKESCATYIEHAWLEDTAGDDELRYELERSRRDYWGEADERYVRPIVTRTFDSSWQMYDHHLYAGGAIRLHLLRKTLGDELFWDAVADYVANFAHKVVETDDFRRTLEERSGRSLGKWFDQWIHSPGYPKLKVGFEHDDDRGVGTFTIEQTQVDAAAGVPAFEFQLDLGWRSPQSDGYDVETVTIDAARHVVVVPMATAPVELRVDPGAKVPARVEFDPGHDKLAAQLTDAPDITGRIHAGQTLLHNGRRKGVEAVRAAWPKEPFYGVRVFWAEALGRSHSTAAIEALTELVAGETHAHVLEPLFRAAARYRDEALAEAVAARLAGGLPPRATQAAYLALGAQRESRWLETLTRGATTEGFNGVAQAGALLGLGNLGSEAALSALWERWPPEQTPMLARPFAVEALAQCALALPEFHRSRVVEALTDLLRDPNHRVRTAAVRGLERLGATQAAAAMERYAGGLATQDRVGVERAVSRMRSGASVPTAALGDELDRLKGTVRDLRDQLDRLTARLDERDKARR